MQKFTVPIRGMHCKSCELRIEGNLNKIGSVKRCSVSHTGAQAKIWYEGQRPALKDIAAAVEAAGYTLGQEDKKHWFTRDVRAYFYVAMGGAILFLLYLAAQIFGFGKITESLSQRSTAVPVLVGLVAGVSSCMALIGGLVLALSARHAELHPEATRWQKFRPHLFFNLGRIVGFAILGGAIGALGGVLQPSVRTMAVLTLAVGLVMVLLGLKLTEIFPILQKVNITMPKFISRLLGTKPDAAEYSHTSAFLGGALTFFLPCGFTQSMQIYAISLGNFTQGLVIMSLFALGTTPGLLGIGGLSSVFRGAKAKLFFATAGLAVVLLGTFNIANANRILFPQKVGMVAAPNAPATGTVQEVRMTQGNSGYSPNQFTVKKGSTVKWIINSTNQYTCASFLVVPALNIRKNLKAGENIVEFTPTAAGEIAFSCTMGMYRGKFVVVD